MVEREHAVLRDEPKFEALPQGIYTAQIVDIVYKQNLQTKFGLKNKYYIYMGILDEKARARKIVHFVNDSFYSGLNGGQASKLYEFVNTVVGEPIKEDFDINSLVGAKVKLVVKQTSRDGKTFSNIDSVLTADLSENFVSLNDGEKNGCMPKKDEEVKATEIPF